MSIQFEMAAKSILNMGYFKNENAKSGNTTHGHEDSIARKFIDNGFSVADKKSIPALTAEIFKEWADVGFKPIGFLEERTNKEYKQKKWIAKTKRFKDMPLGSFIQQPCGSNKFPDFLIRDFDGRFLILEAKSGKKQDSKEQDDDATIRAPMWNDNLPKYNEVIYVYSNEKNNKTTIALGQDVIDLEVIDLRRKYDEERNIIDMKYKPLVEAADKKNRGWHITSRPQNFQSGGSEKTDWFHHESRVECENNVLIFALGK